MKIFAIDSNQSGVWSDTNTWVGSNVPTSTDPVTILAGHTVTVDISTATASITTINGTLTFDRVLSSTLTMVGGDMNVNAGGTLDMGTEASPIPAGVFAHLVLAYGSTGGEFGLIINDGGNF